MRYNQMVTLRYAMKTSLLIFLTVAVCTVLAVPLTEEASDGTYERFINFPDGDGVMREVDLEAEPNFELLDEISRNPANNIYKLYTRQNPKSPQTLVINDAESITSSNFNPEHQTVVISHGWLSNQKAALNPTIRDAYLRKGEANVIIIDWRRLALSDYVTAVRGVPDVGRGLGQFLAFVNRVTGAPFDKMHLIGFSLGAHLVGNAGRELGGRVARVTGLDPAGPLWSFNNEKLRSTDGIYVEGIHTDGHIGYGLGYGSPLGDADFFPNGGKDQPGCLTPICDHNRSWEFFAATVTHNHLVGRECSNYVQITLNTCRGRELHMGNDVLTKSGSGKFRVNTRRRYPF